MKRQLRDLREKLNLTLDDVAKAVGTDRSTVSNWERLVREPAAEFRKPLAKVLKLSLKELAEIVYLGTEQVRG